MAHSSKPMAHAVIDKYETYKIKGVVSLNCILSELKANPAIIAAIDDIPLYSATK